MPIYAQLIPNFGGQRTGLSASSFLKNDMNPRSMAMGGAGVALAPDGFTIFTNPAASANIEHFNVSISSLTVGAGMNQSFISAIIPRKDKLSSFGISLNMLNSGEQEVRTEFQPRGTGEVFYALDFATGLTYAQQLSDMFSAGMTLKYIHNQIDVFSASTVAADVSFLYITDYQDLKFAVMIQNFGGNSSLNGDDIPTDFNRGGSIETENYTLPTVFQLGASIVPWKEEHQSLMMSVQLNHPNDNSENYRFGLEYEYLELLYLRAGYKLNVRGDRFPTFGFGLRHRLGGHPLHVSYAANPTQFRGVQHTIGISFSLNKMNREER
ncbi:MAG: hypothetical protein CMO34_03760 [Verrucomicrobia bacterium]|nr:hypothetical protein [Verrucomicrobiota bacterium]|tara:strand:- start:557 stop:1528 length:972 start_codon:yes stop_codon:yes gene_type:complete